MCNNCDAGSEDLGEVIPGLHLHYATITTRHIGAGGFALTVGSDGFDFAIPQYIDVHPDPVDGMTDDEINALTDLAPLQRWFYQLELFTDACRCALDLATAAKITLLSRSAGWDPDVDGSLESWLFHRIGVHIAKNAPEKRPVEDPVAEAKERLEKALPDRVALAERIFRSMKDDLPMPPERDEGYGHSDRDLVVASAPSAGTPYVLVQGGVGEPSPDWGLHNANHFAFEERSSEKVLLYCTHGGWYADLKFDAAGKATELIIHTPHGPESHPVRGIRLTAEPVSHWYP